MRITGANKKFDVTVNLVGSKSISNRALMIAYYGGFNPRITNLSESDDTKLLNEILQSINNPSVPNHLIAPTLPATINCHNSGTVFRFLLTALSFKNGEYILTGSDRMLHRPIGDLVDALRSIDANIEYMGQEGYPPLIVNGRDLKIDNVSVNITKSSQFASSILLAMPKSLHLDGDLSSLPYIDLTIDIMQHFGAKIHRECRDIFIKRSEYQDVKCCVESDWTCASYWYEAVALSENGHARLKNLHLYSKQGDAIVAKWFEKFGVKSIQDGDDVVISHVETDENPSHFDFINNPDLYPTIAATCAGLGVKAQFTGLRNLIHKESDRVAAMTTELSKIMSVPIFDSHNDHRIAMALAPLALKIGAIEINNADVVSKSYPNFWEEFIPILK